MRRAVTSPYLLLFVSPIILFSPVFLTGKALFWGTPSTQFIPWWHTAWWMLSQGQLPAWNPWLGMGAPLLANYQSALAYPPTWLYWLFWLGGGVALMAWAQALLVAAHLIFAGTGMALLLRRIGLGQFPQVLGGLAYALSGYLVARAGFLSINASAAWLPWILWCVSGLSEEIKGSHRGDLGGPPAGSGLPDYPPDAARRSGYRLIRAAALLALVMALQLLAGHAQTVQYTLCLALAWGIFWSAQPEAPNLGRAGRLRNAGKLIGIFLLALIFSVALAAVQLFPTAEYLLESQRSGAVDYQAAMTYSFWPWRLLGLLAPSLFGNPAHGDYWGYANFWEDAIYIGLVPIALALAAIVVGLRKSALVKFLIILVGLSLLLSLGKNTPIFPWLYRNVPGFDMFQAPTRINLLAVFALATLAALGAAWWRRPTGRGLYWTRLGVMAALAVTVGSILVALLPTHLFTEIRPSSIRAVGLAGLWAAGLAILTLKAPVEPRAGPAHQPLSRWGWAVLLWTMADLLVAGWGLNPAVGLDFYRNPAPDAGRVRAIVGEGRLFLPEKPERALKFDQLFRFDTFDPFATTGSWEALRASMLPNLTLLDGIRSANNFDPLLPGRYAQWMAALQQANGETQERLLDLMAVAAIESIDPSQAYGVRFDARQPLPRLRWVPCGILVRDGSEALARLLADEAAGTDYVVLEADPGSRSPLCGDGRGEFKLESERSGWIIIDIQASSPGYLLQADVWYPGWSARLDGRMTGLLKANYLFRAVEVPAGRHRVEIYYRPVPIYAGAMTSLLSWIGLVVLLLWAARFNFRISSRNNHQTG